MSRQFKDTQGHEYTVSITVGLAERIKAETEIDLMDFRKIQDTVGSLSMDRSALCKVLHLVSETSRKSLGVSDQEFWDGMDGDTLDAALDAFVEGLVDFYPLAQREGLRAAWRQIGEVHGRLWAEVTKKMDSPEMRAKIEKVIETAGQSLTSAPESLE